MYKLFVFLIFISAIRNDAYVVDHNGTLDDTIDKASMKLLKNVYDSSGEKNVISSPLGVLMLLFLYSIGSTGTTKEEVFRFLGLTGNNQVMDAYKPLTEKFTTMDTNVLALANKVYVSNRYRLLDSYLNVAIRDYNSDVEAIDFTDSREAANMINRWASHKTHGKITNPVSADAFGADTAAALFNVIYFRGHWQYRFSQKDTIPRTFHVSKSESVLKPTMKLRAKFRYHADVHLGARTIELPYKETGFRMVVVLPNAVDGLPAVLRNISQEGILKHVLVWRPFLQVDLYLPKFDINSNFNLRNILEKEGVKNIFTNGATGIVEGKELKASEVFQEAYVKVDEEGSEAAAFTGFLLVSKPLSAEPFMEFKVDRPFLYAILHQNTVLFAGTYTH